MKDNKTEYLEKLFLAIEIQNRFAENSEYLDNKTKEAIVNYGNYVSDRIQKESFTLTQLKSWTKDILTLWNESISPDAELFWIELRKKGIDFERKDELNFALTKGRFRRVESGMGARKYWTQIREFPSIKNRFSKSEIVLLDKIIEKDEKTRLDILTRCLIRKEIVPSLYLKFGECMAYFYNCSLFEKYFSKEQVEELSTIWTKFNTV